MDAYSLFNLMYDNGLFLDASKTPKPVLPFERKAAKEECYERNKNVIEYLAKYITSFENMAKRLSLLKTNTIVVTKDKVWKTPIWKKLPVEDDGSTRLDGDGVEQKLCKDGKYVYLFELDDLPTEPEKTEELKLDFEQIGIKKIEDTILNNDNYGI